MSIRCGDNMALVFRVLDEWFEIVFIEFKCFCLHEIEVGNAEGNEKLISARDKISCTAYDVGLSSK